MKTLIIGPNHREKEYFSKKQSSFFPKGQGQYFWCEALESLGQTVVAWKYTDSILLPNTFRVALQEKLNKYFPVWMGRIQRKLSTYYFISLENVAKNISLLLFVIKEKPDLILVSGGGWNIFPETFWMIKKIVSAPLYLLSGINPLVASPPAEKNAVKKGVFDIIFSNDKGFALNWIKLGAKKAIELPVSAISPNFHKKQILSKNEQKELASDVCFVGGLTPLRQKTLLELTSLPLKIWGEIMPGIDLSPQLKPFYQGRATGEKMFKIYSVTKIALNLQPDMIAGGNLRTFEIPACGAFQLIDKLNPKYFTDGEDIVVYSSLKDLKQKIRYYLSHKKEREEIALKGYKRVLKQHTYQNRFKTLLSYVSKTTYTK